MKKNLKPVIRYRYFAYGSNMCRERLERRVGKVRKIGVGFLNDYEMSFNCGWKISFANVIPSKGKRTFGVLYALTKKQLAKLDSYEVFYKRQVLKINDKKAIVYVSESNDKEFTFPPSIDYIKVILEGYLENNYPKGYNKLRNKIKDRYGRLINA